MLSVLLNSWHLSIFILVQFIVVGCSSKKALDSKEVKAQWGIFESGQLVKTKLVDYTKTPIFKHISEAGKLHPSHTYLNEIEIHSMAYISDSLLVTGFMVRPKAKGNYPCIIFNRGGNGEFGILLVATAVNIMAPMAAKGYIVIASNYRGNSGSEGREEFGGADVDDVLNLIPVLGQIPDADTSKIGMFGVSRGGMMTYLAMSQSNRIKTGVVSAGIANLFSMKKDRPEMEKNVYAHWIPNYERNKENTLKARSVVFWPQKLPPDHPILIMHGTNDDRVNYEEALEIANKFDSINFPYQFISFKDDNHGLQNHREKAMEIVADWFDLYLVQNTPFGGVEKRILVE